MGGDKDRWFWTFAVGAALIVVGTIYGSGGKASGASLHGADAPPPAVPRVASDFTERAPAAPAHHAGVIASVYECRTGGRRVFSDERCGSDARVRAIQAPSRMDAQDTRILAEPVLEPVRFNAPETGSGSAADNRAECMSLESQRDAINARMREGYGAGEGEILRERLRGLSDESYRLRCRHFH